MTEPTGLVTIKDAAARCGVHPNTIRNLILRGELRAVRIGARIVRINAEDLGVLFTNYVPGEYGTWNR
ncbi:DNA-binding protein [bacterium]|nr:DNA-binding protein [bacterium]